MKEVMQGKEVDNEGAQCLQSIWPEGGSENKSGEAGTASPEIPNTSTMSMNISHTAEVVEIEYVATAEETFTVTLAVNEESTTPQEIRRLLQDLRTQDNMREFHNFMEHILARTDEGQVRFELFDTKVPQLPPPSSTSAEQMNVLFGNSRCKGLIPSLQLEARDIIRDIVHPPDSMMNDILNEHVTKYTTSQLRSVVCACAILEWIKVQDDKENPHSLISIAQKGEFKRQAPEENNGATDGAEDTAPEIQHYEDEEKGSANSEKDYVSAEARANFFLGHDQPQQFKNKVETSDISSAGSQSLSLGEEWVAKGAQLKHLHYLATAMQFASNEILTNVIPEDEEKAELFLRLAQQTEVKRRHIWQLTQERKHAEILKQFSSTQWTCMVCNQDSDEENGDDNIKVPRNCAVCLSMIHVDDCLDYIMDDDERTKHYALTELPIMMKGLVKRDPAFGNTNLVLKIFDVVRPEEDTYCPLCLWSLATDELSILKSMKAAADPSKEYQIYFLLSTDAPSTLPAKLVKPRDTSEDSNADLAFGGSDGGSSNSSVSPLSVSTQETTTAQGSASEIELGEDSSFSGDAPSESSQEPSKGTLSYAQGIDVLVRVMSTIQMRNAISTWAFNAKTSQDSNDNATPNYETNMGSKASPAQSSELPEIEVAHKELLQQHENHLLYQVECCKFLQRHRPQYVTTGLKKFMQYMATMVGMYFHMNKPDSQFVKVPPQVKSSQTVLSKQWDSLLGHLHAFHMEVKKGTLRDVTSEELQQLQEQASSYEHQPTEGEITQAVFSPWHSLRSFHLFVIQYLNSEIGIELIRRTYPLQLRRSWNQDDPNTSIKMGPDYWVESLTRMILWMGTRAHELDADKLIVVMHYDAFGEECQPLFELSFQYQSLDPPNPCCGMETDQCCHQGCLVCPAGQDFCSTFCEDLTAGVSTMDRLQWLETQLVKYHRAVGGGLEETPQPANKGRPPLAPRTPSDNISPLASSLRSGSNRSATGSVSSKESGGGSEHESDLPTPLELFEALNLSAHDGTRVYYKALEEIVSLTGVSVIPTGTKAKLQVVSGMLKSVHLHCHQEDHESTKQNPVGDGCDLYTCCKGWIQQILSKLLTQMAEFDQVLPELRKFYDEASTGSHDTGFFDNQNEVASTLFDAITRVAEFEAALKFFIQLLKKMHPVCASEVDECYLWMKDTLQPDARTVWNDMCDESMKTTDDQMYAKTFGMAIKVAAIMLETSTEALIGRTDELPKRGSPRHTTCKTPTSSKTAVKASETGQEDGEAEVETAEIKESNPLDSFMKEIQTSEKTVVQPASLTVEKVSKSTSQSLLGDPTNSNLTENTVVQFQPITFFEAGQIVSEFFSRTKTPKTVKQERDRRLNQRLVPKPGLPDSSLDRPLIEAIIRANTKDIAPPLGGKGVIAKVRSVIKWAITSQNGTAPLSPLRFEGNLITVADFSRLATWDHKLETSLLQIVNCHATWCFIITSTRVWQLVYQYGQRCLKNSSPEAQSVVNAVCRDKYSSVLDAHGELKADADKVLQFLMGDAFDHMKSLYTTKVKENYEARLNEHHQRNEGHGMSSVHVPLVSVEGQIYEIFILMLQRASKCQIPYEDQKRKAKSEYFNALHMSKSFATKNYDLLDYLRGVVKAGIHAQNQLCDGFRPNQLGVDSEAEPQAYRESMFKWLLVKIVKDVNQEFVAQYSKAVSDPKVDMRIRDAWTWLHRNIMQDVEAGDRSQVYVINVRAKEEADSLTTTVKPANLFWHMYFEVSNFVNGSTLHEGMRAALQGRKTQASSATGEKGSQAKNSKSSKPTPKKSESSSTAEKKQKAKKDFQYRQKYAARFVKSYNVSQALVGQAQYNRDDKTAYTQGLNYTKISEDRNFKSLKLSELSSPVKSEAFRRAFRALHKRDSNKYPAPPGEDQRICFSCMKVVDKAHIQAPCTQQKVPYSKDLETEAQKLIPVLFDKSPEGANMARLQIEYSKKKDSGKSPRGGRGRGKGARGGGRHGGRGGRGRGKGALNPQKKTLRWQDPVDQQTQIPAQVQVTMLKDAAPTFIPASQVTETVESASKKERSIKGRLQQMPIADSSEALDGKNYQISVEQVNDLTTAYQPQEVMIYQSQMEQSDKMPSQQSGYYDDLTDYQVRIPEESLFSLSKPIPTKESFGHLGVSILRFHNSKDSDFKDMKNCDVKSRCVLQVPNVLAHVEIEATRVYPMLKNVDVSFEVTCSENPENDKLRLTAKNTACVQKRLKMHLQRRKESQMAVVCHVHVTARAGQGGAPDAHDISRYRTKEFSKKDSNYSEGENRESFSSRVLQTESIRHKYSSLVSRTEVPDDDNEKLVLIAEAFNPLWNSLSFKTAWWLIANIKNAVKYEECDENCQEQLGMGKPPYLLSSYHTNYRSASQVYPFYDEHDKGNQSEHHEACEILSDTSPEFPRPMNPSTDFPQLTADRIDDLGLNPAILQLEIFEITFRKLVGDFLNKGENLSDNQATAKTLTALEKRVTTQRLKVRKTQILLGQQPHGADVKTDSVLSNIEIMLKQLGPIPLQEMTFQQPTSRERGFQAGNVVRLAELWCHSIIHTPEEFDVVRESMTDQLPGRRSPTNPGLFKFEHEDTSGEEFDEECEKFFDNMKSTVLEEQHPDLMKKFVIERLQLEQRSGSWTLMATVRCLTELTMVKTFPTSVLMLEYLDNPSFWPIYEQYAEHAEKIDCREMYELKDEWIVNRHNAIELDERWDIHVSTTEIKQVPKLWSKPPTDYNLFPEKLLAEQFADVQTATYAYHVLQHTMQADAALEVYLEEIERGGPPGLNASHRSGYSKDMPSIAQFYDDHRQFQTLLREHVQTCPGDQREKFPYVPQVLSESPFTGKLRGRLLIIFFKDPMIKQFLSRQWQRDSRAIDPMRYHVQFHQHIPWGMNLNKYQATAKEIVATALPTYGLVKVCTASDRYTVGFTLLDLMSNRDFTSLRDAEVDRVIWEATAEVWKFFLAQHNLLRDEKWAAILDFFDNPDLRFKMDVHVESDHRIIKSLDLSPNIVSGHVDNGNMEDGRIRPWQMGDIECMKGSHKALGDEEIYLLNTVRTIICGRDHALEHLPHGTATKGELPIRSKYLRRPCRSDTGLSRSQMGMNGWRKSHLDDGKLVTHGAVYTKVDVPPTNWDSFLAGTYVPDIHPIPTELSGEDSRLASFHFYSKYNMDHLTAQTLSLYEHETRSFRKQENIFPIQVKLDWIFECILSQICLRTPEGECSIFQNGEDDVSERFLSANRRSSEEPIVSRNVSLETVTISDPDGTNPRHVTRNDVVFGLDLPRRDGSNPIDQEFGPLKEGLIHQYNDTDVQYSSYSSDEEEVAQSEEVLATNRNDPVAYSPCSSVDEEGVKSEPIPPRTFDSWGNVMESSVGCRYYPTKDSDRMNPDRLNEGQPTRNGSPKHSPNSSCFWSIESHRTEGDCLNLRTEFPFLDKDPETGKLVHDPDDFLYVMPRVPSGFYIGGSNNPPIRCGQPLVLNKDDGSNYITNHMPISIWEQSKLEHGADEFHKHANKELHEFTRWLSNKSRKGVRVGILPIDLDPLDSRRKEQDPAGLNIAEQMVKAMYLDNPRVEMTDENSIALDQSMLSEGHYVGGTSVPPDFQIQQMLQKLQSTGNWLDMQQIIEDMKAHTQYQLPKSLTEATHFLLNAPSIQVHMPEDQEQLLKHVLVAYDRRNSYGESVKFGLPPRHSSGVEYVNDPPLENTLVTKSRYNKILIKYYVEMSPWKTSGFNDLMYRPGEVLSRESSTLPKIRTHAVSVHGYDEPKEAWVPASVGPYLEPEPSLLRARSESPVSDDGSSDTEHVTDVTQLLSTEFHSPTHAIYANLQRSQHQETGFGAGLATGSTTVGKEGGVEKCDESTSKIFKGTKAQESIWSNLSELQVDHIDTDGFVTPGNISFSFENFWDLGGEHPNHFMYIGDDEQFCTEHGDPFMKAFSFLVESYQDDRTVRYLKLKVKFIVQWMTSERRRGIRHDFEMKGVPLNAFWDHDPGAPVEAPPTLFQSYTDDIGEPEMSIEMGFGRESQRTKDWFFHKFGHLPREVTVSDLYVPPACLRMFDIWTKVQIKCGSSVWLRPHESPDEPVSLLHVLSSGHEQIVKPRQFPHKNVQENEGEYRKLAHEISLQDCPERRQKVFFDVTSCGNADEVHDVYTSDFKPFSHLNVEYKERSGTRRADDQQHLTVDELSNRGDGMFRRRDMATGQLLKQTRIQHHKGRISEDVATEKASISIDGATNIAKLHHVLRRRFVVSKKESGESSLLNLLGPQLGENVRRQAVTSRPLQRQTQQDMTQTRIYLEPGGKRDPVKDITNGATLTKAQQVNMLTDSTSKQWFEVTGTLRPTMEKRLEATVKSGEAASYQGTILQFEQENGSQFTGFCPATGIPLQIDPRHPHTEEIGDTHKEGLKNIPGININDNRTRTQKVYTIRDGVTMAIQPQDSDLKRLTSCPGYLMDEYAPFELAGSYSPDTGEQTPPMDVQGIERYSPFDNVAEKSPLTVPRMLFLKTGDPRCLRMCLICNVIHDQPMEVVLCDPKEQQFVIKRKCPIKEEILVVNLLRTSRYGPHLDKNWKGRGSVSLSREQEYKNATCYGEKIAGLVDASTRSYDKNGFRYHHVNHQTSLAVMGPYLPQQLPGNAPLGAGTTNIQCLCGSFGDHDHCQLSELALRVHNQDDEEECKAFKELQGLIDRYLSHGKMSSHTNTSHTDKRNSIGSCEKWECHDTKLEEQTKDEVVHASSVVSESTTVTPQFRNCGSSCKVSQTVTGGKLSVPVVEAYRTKSSSCFDDTDWFFPTHTLDFTLREEEAKEETTATVSLANLRLQYKLRKMKILHEEIGIIDPLHELLERQNELEKLPAGAPERAHSVAIRDLLEIANYQQDNTHLQSKGQVPKDQGWRSQATGSPSCVDMFPGLKEALETPYDGRTTRMVAAAGVAEQPERRHYPEPPLVHAVRLKPENALPQLDITAYVRQGPCTPGTEDGLPYPSMKNRTDCSDGSYMAVLDTGAEISLVSAPNADLVPFPKKIPLTLNSFAGESSICPLSGEIIAAAISRTGKSTGINFGYAGVGTSNRDNLLSGPTMRKLGYSFWLGQFPFMLTPQNEEIPLYQQPTTGYWTIRLYPVDSSEKEERMNVKAKPLRSSPHTIGYLHHDEELWHGRCIHAPIPLLKYMKKNNLCVGLPSLGKLRDKPCLSCGMGKACKQHVGPANYSDKAKVMEELKLRAEAKQVEFYPLEQIHMDTCYLDAKDLHGNDLFLVIVDRATDMKWTYPMSSTKQVAGIVESFMEHVCEPYHRFRMHKEVRERVLERIGTSEVQRTEKWKQAQMNTPQAKKLIREFVKEQGKLVSGLRRVRCDSGSEFKNQFLKKVLINAKKNRHVKLDLAAPDVKDGRAEAAIKTLTTYTRTCLIASNLRKCFWSHIMSMVTHVCNRLYSHRRGSVPYTDFTGGIKPDFSYFRIPGSTALVWHMDPVTKLKLEERAFLGILIDYDTVHESWVFFDPVTRKKIKTHHAIFYERQRDPQEMIDMGDMILQEPVWNSVTHEKDQGWRCQLWPKYLWPGEKPGEVDRYLRGNRSRPKGPAFGETLLDSEGNLDEQELLIDPDEKGNTKDTRSQKKKVSTAHQKVLLKQKRAKDPMDEVQLTKDAVLIQGPMFGNKKFADYLNRRAEMVVGLRIGDLFDEKMKGKYKCHNTHGKLKIYSSADMKYDIKGGRLVLGEGPVVEGVDHAVNQSVSPGIQYVQEEVQSFPTSVIVHSLNCTSTSARGEVGAIFKKYGYANVYQDKSRFDSRIPGNILVSEPSNSQNSGPVVVSLLDHVYPGKPKGRLLKYSGRPGFQVDSSAQRRRWFLESLERLHHYVLENKEELTSISFSFGLGRPMSSEDWSWYHDQLSCLATQLHSTRIYVCVRPKDVEKVSSLAKTSWIKTFSPSEPSAEDSPNKKKKHQPFNTAFFDGTSEVKHLYGKLKFDEMYGFDATATPVIQDDGISDSDTEEPEVQQLEWGRESLGSIAAAQVIDPRTDLPVKTEIQESYMCNQGFLQAPLAISDRSGAVNVVLRQSDLPPALQVTSPEIDASGDYKILPKVEELLSYRGNGTYINKHGRVEPSHSVKNEMRGQTMDLNQIRLDGLRHVLNVPSAKQINEAIDSKIQIKVPGSTKSALKSHPMWKSALFKEIEGLMDMGCFSRIRSNHPDVRLKGTLPSHVVFAAKFDAENKFLKAKARLVAGGNHEEAPENAFENFSPTAGATINRFFDAYCTYRSYNMYSTDCTAAFLNAPMGNKKVYIRPPPGIEEPGVVWKLEKHLYGLCSSPAAWMDTLTTALKTLGFESFGDDPCLMKRIDEDGDEIILEVFVDDIKWGGKDEYKIKKVIEQLSSQDPNGPLKGNGFKITFDQELKSYLGMLYNHSRDDQGNVTLTVNQTGYIETLITRFGLDGDEHKPVDTPMIEHSNEEDLEKKLNKTLESTSGRTVPDNEWLRQWAKDHSFPQIIGSLLHAMVHTRPDLAYCIAVLSRNMAPGRTRLYHFKAAYRVMCYLKGTKHLGLVYCQKQMHNMGSLVNASIEESIQNNNGEFVDYDKFLEAAVDASFADCVESYRSTSGFVVWFGGSPIEYECKRQGLVTLSTMESEYVGASKCVCSLRFIKKLMEFVRLENGTTKIHEDNSACVAISTKTVHKSRSKHIGTKYHNVREAALGLANDGTPEIELVQVWTDHQVADIFTKALGREKFVRFREVLLGHKPWSQMCKENLKPATVNAMQEDLDESVIFADPTFQTTECISQVMGHATVQATRLTPMKFGMRSFGMFAYNIPVQSDWTDEESTSLIRSIMQPKWPTQVLGYDHHGNFISQTLRKDEPKYFRWTADQEYYISYANGESVIPAGSHFYTERAFDASPVIGWNGSVDPPYGLDQVPLVTDFVDTDKVYCNSKSHMLYQTETYADLNDTAWTHTYDSGTKYAKYYREQLGMIRIIAHTDTKARYKYGDPSKWHQLTIPQGSGYYLGDSKLHPDSPTHKLYDGEPIVGRSGSYDPPVSMDD